MKVTKISTKGLELIKKYEGFKAKPYLCPSSVPTIGYGSTYYEDGTKVKLTDPAITQERATELLMALLVSYEKAVDSYCVDTINQNQFDALCSFVYNCGNQALKNSTLLRKINGNRMNPDIANEFLKWNRGGGRVIPGLSKRRQEEADLYFS
jgi:lysozyme